MHDCRSSHRCRRYHARVRWVQTDRFDVQQPAAHVLSNLAACGTAAQIGCLVEHGAVPALVGVLHVPDTPFVLAALAGLGHILASERARGLRRLEALMAGCDGLVCIENLLEHASQDVYRRAVSHVTTLAACIR